MAHSDNPNRDLERFLADSCGCVEESRSAPATVACDDAALMLSQTDASGAAASSGSATSV